MKHNPDLIVGPGYTQTIDVKSAGDDVEVVSTLTQNNIPILEQNYIEKMNGSEGWTDKRHFRKIGRVPRAAYLKAQAEGYDMDNEKDVIKFLSLHPEFSTVRNLTAVGSNHQIIIK